MQPDHESNAEESEVNSLKLKLPRIGSATGESISVKFGGIKSGSIVSKEKMILLSNMRINEQ